MAIDRKVLASRIRELHDLSADEKSELLELLNNRKKYGLVWEDKLEKVEDELHEKLPVLKEVTKRRILSKESDAPDHILIEGDNLHALTALQYTHAGKIDVIYIDPPYNTGNKDFIYNDSFVDKEDAWRHSKWLSFMSKRLKLAKHLLKETGVIFISIDDNEQGQLKLLCDEVFGEGNLIAKTTIVSNPRGRQSDSFFATVHEYLIIYAKNIGICVLKGIELDEENKDEYKFNDNEGKKYRLLGLRQRGSESRREDRPEMFFPIYVNAINLKCSIKKLNGYLETVIPKKSTGADGRWMWGKDKCLRDESLLVAKYIKKRNEYDVFVKDYLEKNGKERQRKARTVWDAKELNTQNGTQEVKAIIGNEMMSYPKPVYLLKTISSIACYHVNSLILDFFAGSGTTLHATMALNAEDGGSRQCILVTNNENDICEKVTYERNKRVIQGYTNPNGEMVPGLTQNNLRYYQVGFVDRSPSMKNRKELTYCAVDLLCIRENCYEPMEVTTKEILVFGRKSFDHETLGIHEKEKEKVLVVILEPRKIEVAVSMIKKLPGHCKVYVFSPGHYAFDDEFEEVVEKIELCALPEAILQAYNKVLPKAKRKLIAELEKGELEE